MYKAGYDPTSFVDFFEKIQSMEKKKPGTMAKVFSSHPMTDDRIKDSQKNIQEILAAKPEYVVTTSEFNDVEPDLALAEPPQARRQGRQPSRLKKAPGGSTRRLKTRIQSKEAGRGGRTSDSEAPDLIGYIPASAKDGRPTPQRVGRFGFKSTYTLLTNR